MRSHRKMKEASSKRREGGVVGESDHTIAGDVLLSWDKFLEEEDSHDGNLINW